jgi:hypothetical protein
MITIFIHTYMHACMHTHWEALGRCLPALITIFIHTYTHTCVQIHKPTHTPKNRWNRCSIAPLVGPKRIHEYSIHTYQCVHIYTYRLNDPVFKVWGCWKLSACLPKIDPALAGDSMCYAYHEAEHKWYAWGPKSEVMICNRA